MRAWTFIHFLIWYYFHLDHSQAKKLPKSPLKTLTHHGKWWKFVIATINMKKMYAIIVFLPWTKFTVLHWLTPHELTRQEWTVLGASYRVSMHLQIGKKSIIFIWKSAKNNINTAYDVSSGFESTTEHVTYSNEARIYLLYSYMFISLQSTSDCFTETTTAWEQLWG